MATFLPLMDDLNIRFSCVARRGFACASGLLPQDSERVVWRIGLSITSGELWALSFVVRYSGVSAYGE